MCKMCIIKTRIQKQSYLNLCIYEVAIKTNWYINISCLIVANVLNLHLLKANTIDFSQKRKPDSLKMKA